MLSAVICPQCGRGDRIEKVAAIVTAGASGRPGDMTAMARARLMASLQPPPRPAALRSRFGWSMVLSLMIVCFAALLIAWGTLAHTPLAGSGAWTNAAVRSLVGGGGVLITLIGLF